MCCASSATPSARWCASIVAGTPVNSPAQTAAATPRQPERSRSPPSELGWWEEVAFGYNGAMSFAQTVPALPMRDGHHSPQLGFGVFQVPPADTQRAVSLALEAGYRHIDTAAAYRNEAGVGEAIRASGLPREQVFVTTKCWNDDQGREESRRAFEASLTRLGLEYVDLYLIHWPVPAHDRYLDTWRTFIDLNQEGLARSIGVSNFKAEHLRRIIDETGHTPAVNQIELHPRLAQPEMRTLHEELGILTESWSPLAQGLVLDHPTITEIAEHHQRTPAQVVIRWHLQLGLVVIPKSVTPARVSENFDVFGFSLSDEEVGAIDMLDVAQRTGPDPDTFIRP